MSVTPIDLSALDAFVEPDTKAQGKPLMLDIDLVHEDPDQPRKTFEDIAELAASVAEVGVKVPISVRPHPDISGAYMVKFGARRRRAAIGAGLTQIPAWIDDVPSDFEQVIENLQRKDLTAMELATFMADKQSAGMKITEIAQKLGIHRTAVHKHLALINAPPEIDAVYQTGRNTSPETIFELRTLFGRYPEETKAWLATGAEVSRRAVDDLKRKLAGVPGAETPVEAATRVTAAKAARQADPMEIKRPLIVVRVGDRHGFVVLNRRANDDDHVLVKWDDTAEVDQVPNREVHFLRLDDARRYEPIHRGLTGTAATTPSHPDEPIPPT
jgi:ParB family chromosome partitioning protein